VKSVLWAAGINLIKNIDECKANLAFTCAVKKNTERFMDSSDITAAFSINPGENVA
jgi:hypothetical protein